MGACLRSYITFCESLWVLQRLCMPLSDMKSNQYNTTERAKWFKLCMLKLDN